MREYSKSLLECEKNRMYVKAIRDLLGFGQYHIVRYMQDERIIRESEVSAIEGKIGYPYLWYAYANFIRQAIEVSEHTDVIKEVMTVLLRTWEEGA